MRAYGSSPHCRLAVPRSGITQALPRPATGCFLERFLKARVRGRYIGLAAMGHSPGHHIVVPLVDEISLRWLGQHDAQHHTDPARDLRPVGVIAEHVQLLLHCAAWTHHIHLALYLSDCCQHLRSRLSKQMTRDTR